MTSAPSSDLTSRLSADCVTLSLTMEDMTSSRSSVKPGDHQQGQYQWRGTSTTSTTPTRLPCHHHHHHTLPLSASSLSSRRYPSSSLLSWPCCQLRRLLLLSLTMAVVTTVAVGVSSMKKEYTLHIALPASVPIRKVRSFSHHPELSELTDNPASLALVSRLQLLDLNGCHGNLSQCQTQAVCDGGDNDLLCRCRRGYYFHHRQCQECKKSCPDGHYLISPCSANTDAVCTPCTMCKGSQYEAAVCTSTRDTICVDVTFPVGILPMNDTHYKDDGTPIAVSHSKNVFLERVSAMKELETPMYVTNNQQTQDFVWHRESGMDIVVGISGVYLIPEYRELSVADDSQFFLTHTMETQSTMDLFSNTQKEYCRHPVPDYYNLHLQVIKNRTSAAQVVRCDSQDPSVPHCPKGYKDGDRYLQWNINKHCDKYHATTGQPPDPLPVLRDGFNTVVCAEETAMDRHIFRLSRPVTLEMMFPSTPCGLARQQCDLCLNSSSCSSQERSRSCCGLSCYNKDACHKFYSPTCPPAEVECASGEVHRFTLMPVFSSMWREWQCHLTYQQPAYLYNISYSLSIPSLGLTVPAQTYTARARSLRQHRRQSAQFHFMQVWHDTRVPVLGEVLLKGGHQELKASQLNHMQPFVLHSLKHRSQLARRSAFFTSTKDTGQFITPVQFERPFLYSSTSWYGDGCHKNVSGIFPNQTIYNNDALTVTGKKLERGGNFGYQISHTDRSPYIKLSVAEGQSVLRWLQDKAARGTIIGQTLSGVLTWDYTHSLWSIHVTGSIENCPAILTLQIFNKMMSACAAIYDIIVACPKNFTLTFNLSRTDDDLPDIFVVIVNDTSSSHQLVLSSVLSPVPVLTSQPHTSQSDGQRRQASWSLWASVLAEVALYLLALVVVAAVYVAIKRSASRAARDPAQLQQPPTETATLNNQATKPAEPRHHQSPLAKKCLCAFVVVYVLYSVLFTFCVTLSLLYFTHHALMGQVRGVANLSWTLQTQLNASFQQVKLHESREEVRLFQSVQGRLQACAVHLQQQNQQYLQKYHDHLTELLSHVYLQDGAIESLAGQSILQNTSIYAEEIQQFLVNCNKTVQSILDRFDSHFLIHAKEVARNSWLDFPREVFLTQEGDPANRKYMSSDQLTRFLHWLQVDKTQDLFGVSQTMAHKVSSLKLPSASDHLKATVRSPFEALLSSLPSQPMVAEHTFLLLHPPPSPVSYTHTSTHPLPPLAYTNNSTHPLPPQPKAASLSGKGSSDKVKVEGGDLGSRQRSVEREREKESEEEPEEEWGVLVYVMIGIFLLLDLLLFAFRMSWMVNQLAAAKAGYEDRMPTDPVCHKLLAIQSGYQTTGMQAMDQPHSYTTHNKDSAPTEERASESEFNVYFCQSYPKSKDDILREIMAQKMNSTEQNLGQEGPPDAQPYKSWGGVGESCAVRHLCSCSHWLFRALVSQLVWGFVVITVLVLLLCVLLYTVDVWLTADNLPLLVGPHSALRDLHLQVHMSNHQLSGLASHLSTVLQDHTDTVTRELALSTALLSSTVNTQRELLVSLLERVCSGAGTPTCNVSSYSALPLPPLSSWQGCNFLPVQAHLYQDVSGGNLDQMVAQQLSPLLQTVQRSLSSLCAIVIAVLFLLFLCHAAATVARYYLLLWGHLPRVQIFQISENTSMMFDSGPHPHKPMQRSASWLESCESGVYVGESELDTNHPPNRDV